jgi:hypothetical protein
MTSENSFLINDLILKACHASKYKSSINILKGSSNSIFPYALKGIFSKDSLFIPANLAFYATSYPKETIAIILHELNHLKNNDFGFIRFIYEFNMKDKYRWANRIQISLFIFALAQAIYNMGFINDQNSIGFTCAFVFYHGLIYFLNIAPKIVLSGIEDIADIQVSESGYGKELINFYRIVSKNMEEKNQHEQMTAYDILLLITTINPMKYSYRTLENRIEMLETVESVLIKNAANNTPPSTG